MRQEREYHFFIGYANNKRRVLVTKTCKSPERTKVYKSLDLIARMHGASSYGYYTND